MENINFPYVVYCCIRLLQGAHYSCLSTNNAFPDDGVTAPKHVGAVLMYMLM